MARSSSSPLFAALAAALLALALPAHADPEGAPANAWPRLIDTATGTVTLYEPQPESLQGSTLAGRAAFSMPVKGKDQPAFGALWFTATVDTDREARTVRIVSAKVTRVRLPDAKPDEEQAIGSEIEKLVPTWDVSLSLDEVTAALAEVQQERAAADTLRAEPPKFLFATEPTVLVLLDGAPVLRPIEKSGVQDVVNTPFPLFFDPKSQAFYLTNGAVWYRAPAVKGPWATVPQPPQEVVQVVAAAGKQDQSAPAPGEAAPPKIVVATEPTELVVTSGPPSYAPVAGTQLLYVTNTESDVFRDIASQKLFVVASGRWFTAPSTEGPWTFVPSNQLPADFARIPAASPKGDVLAFVSGTEAAKEAVMDAQIPQTAAIRRDAPGPKIAYDGPPNFQPIPGTELAYAVNTPSSVLRIQGRYYACVEAVWYLAPAPEGPWAVADSVPPQVQTIPPASPVYNVKYVSVYQATPQFVYVGYTPGYLGCYVWHGAVVYGTGYGYVPYYSPVVYYPRPWTYGFGVRYHPWVGWGYGLTVSSGFLAVGFGWHAGPGYYRPPAYGWYGPGGYRPPIYRAPGYYGPGYHPGRPVGPYPPGGLATPRPLPANLYQRPGNAAGIVPTPAPARVARPVPAARVPNNVYADKDGNVFRQTANGNWQQRNSGAWRPAPSAQRPAPAQIQHDYMARQRGNAAGAAYRANPNARPPAKHPSGTPARPAHKAKHP